jgi:hypothetical protein
MPKMIVLLFAIGIFCAITGYGYNVSVLLVIGLGIVAVITYWMLISDAKKLQHKSKYK